MTGGKYTGMTVEEFEQRRQAWIEAKRKLYQAQVVEYAAHGTYLLEQANTPEELVSLPHIPGRKRGA